MFDPVVMAKPPAPGTTLKAKKRCCKDRPRCKRCPVVLKRLEADGLLRREGPRTYTVVEIVPKGALKAARRRGK